MKLVVCTRSSLEPQCFSWLLWANWCCICASLYGGRLQNMLWALWACLMWAVGSVTRHGDTEWAQCQCRTCSGLCGPALRGQLAVWRHGETEWAHCQCRTCSGLCGPASCRQLAVWRATVIWSRPSFSHGWSVAEVVQLTGILVMGQPLTGQLSLAGTVLPWSKLSR